MLRANGRFSIAILMTFVACAADPAGDPLDTDPPTAEREAAPPDDPAPVSGIAAAEQASTASAAADPVQAAPGCAVVQTCNAAGPDGTRCRQLGCSVGAAALECALESTLICGAAVCPVILIELDGTRENLCKNGRL